MGKHNFTELFILLINLLLLPFNQVIKDRLSLKALNSSLTTSARTQAKRRLCLWAEAKTQAIVFQPLNLRSCLETSVTASGEAEPDPGCHWRGGGGEKTCYCSWPFKHFSVLAKMNKIHTNTHFAAPESFIVSLTHVQTHMAVSMQTASQCVSQHEKLFSAIGSAVC